MAGAERGQALVGYGRGREGVGYGGGEGSRS